jgi:hypothetical protein
MHHEETFVFSDYNIWALATHRGVGRFVQNVFQTIAIEGYLPDSEEPTLQGVDLRTNPPASAHDLTPLSELESDRDHGVPENVETLEEGQVSSEEDVAEILQRGSDVPRGEDPTVTYSIPNSPTQLLTEDEGVISAP